MFDPLKVECKGHYMYGTGFFTHRDQTDAVLKQVPVSGFCNFCVVKTECWKGLKARVDLTKPDEVAAFMREIRKGKAHGLTGGQVAASLMAKGAPDPYMADTLENFRKGNVDATTN